MQSASRPSWIPVVVSVVSCIFSLIIYFVPTLQQSFFIFIAYLFTPFIPILMMAVSQTKHTAASSDIYYDLATGVKVLKIGRAMAVIGFLLAIPVIVEISRNFSEI